jgi:hypothetical protein
MERAFGSMREHLQGMSASMGGPLIDNGFWLGFVH